MIRVWFNHWFSTSYRLIELMKQDALEEVVVLASNKQPNSVIKNVCDEWYKECDLEGEEYIDFCVDFCREHKVDVFVPRRKMVEISRNKKRFEEIGVKVLVDDIEIIELLNDKAATYEFFKDSDVLNIPDWAIVNTPEEFEREYNRLHEKYERICVKFVQDEGAMSFRKIVDDINSFKRIRIYQGSEMEYSKYLESLKEKECFDDLMIMPYLSGSEISVDCLATSKGLIAVPRFKSSARHEYVRFDEKILEMSEYIMRKTKLQCPCNIQFKLGGEVPYLLEINTRMSGGLQMSCLASDINIPNIALNKLLGKDIDWEMKKEDCTVSYIELPQIIRE